MFFCSVCFHFQDPHKPPKHLYVAGALVVVLQAPCRCSHRHGCSLQMATLTSSKLQCYIVRCLVRGEGDVLRNISDGSFEASLGAARVTAHN